MSRVGPSLLVIWVSLLFAATARAAPGDSIRVRIEPVPAWVAPEPAVPHQEIESSQGQAVLLFDQQTRRLGANRERWRFTRARIRITSESGVQEAGQRRFHFVPPHESLILHSLELRRGEQTVSRLKREQIQLLRREVGAEASVYDNARTALIVVPDVRVGDVVSYEYSIVGANPVHQARAMEFFQQTFPVSVGTARYRLLTDRAPHIRTHAGAEPPSMSRIGSLLEYEWQARRPRTVPAREQLPQDYDSDAWVQFSDFDSWQEVAEWGSALFAEPRGRSKLLTEAVEHVRAHYATPEQQVRAVLRRVQDEVRYLSLAFAESTHRPAPPDDVLSRRFGDCKDKSLLAVTLLRALGFDAHVALVSVTDGARLPRLLPASSVFDHAIVSVIVEGHRHWLDPSRLYQRGRLSDLAARNLHHALLLRPDESSLVPIEEPEDARPDVSARLEYQIESFGGPVTLTASVTYTRERAEAIRGARASSSTEELDKSSSGILRETFPQAVRLTPPSFVDREETNEIVVTHDFRLDNPWVVHPDGRSVLTLFPPWMRAQLLVAEANRREPLGLSPVHIVHHVRLQLPEPLRVTDETTRVEEGPFAYEYRVRSHADSIELDHDFAVRGRRVEVADLDAYRAAMSRIQQTLEYAIWKNIAPVSSGSRYPPFVVWLAAGIWLLVLLGAVAFVQVREPYLRRPDIAWEPSLSGRRGWLALLGLGVSLAPLRLVLDVAPNLAAYSELSWRRVTTPDSPEYSEMWAPLLMLELLGNMFLLVCSIHLAYLYWARRRSFALVFVVFQSMAVAIGVADLLLASSIDPQSPAANPAGFLGYALIALAWTAYVLQSRRVKATFLPGPEASRKRRRRKKRSARDKLEHGGVLSPPDA